MIVPKERSTSRAKADAAPESPPQVYPDGLGVCRAGARTDIDRASRRGMPGRCLFVRETLACRRLGAAAAEAEEAAAYSQPKQRQRPALRHDGGLCLEAIA